MRSKAKQKVLTDVTERRCSRKRTGSSGVKPTGGRPPSHPPSEPRNPMHTFLYKRVCLKYNSEPSHVPRVQFAIMILSWPRTSGSAAHFLPMPSRERPRIRPTAHTSSRHAPRACSVQQHDCLSPAPPRHSGRHGGDGLLTSPITLPPPPEALRRCIAPVLLLSLLRSAAARVPPLSRADLAVADSRLSACRRPAGRRRGSAGRFRQRFRDRAERAGLKG